MGELEFEHQIFVHLKHSHTSLPVYLVSVCVCVCVESIVNIYIEHRTN